MKIISKWTLPVISFLSALPFMGGVTGCVGKRCNLNTGHGSDANRTEELRPVQKEEGPFEDSRTAEPGYICMSEQLIEDNRTAERVREALAAGADYKYDEVKVISSNGVVQLNGFVKTSVQKSRAAEVTSKVVGVKSVENNLRDRN